MEWLGIEFGGESLDLLLVYPQVAAEPVASHLESVFGPVGFESRIRHFPISLFTSPDRILGLSVPLR
jgi:hypothetical protein